MKREMDLENDEIIIENVLPHRTVKNIMTMEKGSERFPIKINKDPFYDD